MTRYELIGRNFLLALRRAPRDKRALYALLWLLWVVGYFTYLVETFSYLGLWGSICWATVLGLAVGLAILIKRNNARSEKSLLSLSSHRSPHFQDLIEHRRCLIGLLLRTAILVDRAGCEVLHNSGKVAEEQRGMCRRRTLDLAQRPELWAYFNEEDKGLLIAAEGSWSWDTIWPRLLLSEDVRVLRWVVGVDSILVPFEFLKFELNSALAVTIKPSIVEGKGCMPPWDLRPAETWLTYC